MLLCGAVMLPPKNLLQWPIRGYGLLSSLACWLRRRCGGIVRLKRSALVVETKTLKVAVILGEISKRFRSKKVFYLMFGQQ